MISEWNALTLRGKNTNQAKTSELGNKEIVGSNDKCTLKYY